ncbi:MFS transporter [Clostridium sp. HMP27]|uniref:MFS transporter n=1 Tax=Clostridium sp. HMP27 TaxID=1487921 RepID=UPI00052BD15A|nr:MFS transporter [Clostridium sp. HMP27]KGK90117.1 MFS transporter [Clostridium sp. HMP27]MBE6068543.1 MFS transporter [Clostridium lundense]
MKNMNFILLMFGRMISDTGSGIQMVVMPLYIIDSGGSSATVGLFSFLSLVPALIIYPFAGVLADRLDRKMITVLTDLGSAAAVMALAFGAHLDKMSLTLLLSMQVAVSLFYGLFDPATKGMLPQLVPQDELTKANSTLATLRILGGLLGPVIGAALYAKVGITAVFFINGISFLMSAGSSLLIKYRHVKREQSIDEKGFAADFSDGIKFILTNKAILKLCVFFLIIYAVIQPIFSVILPLFFRTQLEYSDTQYGYLQMIIILGALLGTILLSLLFGKEKDMTKSLVSGCSLLMFAMLAFSLLLFPHSLFVLGKGSILYFYLLSGTLGLISIAIMFINVPIQTFIQKSTPNEYMSRMFSIVGMITKGGMPLGALVYGIVLNRALVHWTVMTSALLMLIVLVVFLVSVLKKHEF